MIKHSERHIRDLPEDSLILKLLREIAEVTQIPLEPFRNNDKSMVIHYLVHYRAKRPITKDSLDAIPFSDEYLLKKKISKLHETEIYLLCNEIAQMKRTGVEKISGMTLYVFLDRYLNEKQKKKKRQLPGFLIP